MKLRRIGEFLQCPEGCGWREAEPERHCPHVTLAQAQAAVGKAAAVRKGGGLYGPPAHKGTAVSPLARELAADATEAFREGRQLEEQRRRDRERHEARLIGTR
jgi:hypothetical protein